MVIGPEEGANADAIPRKVMASRLMINSKVVQAILLETILYHTLSLLEKECYCASSQNGVERKETLIEKGWSCG